MSDGKSKPIPILLCGKFDTHIEATIAGVRPEFESKCSMQPFHQPFFCPLHLLPLRSQPLTPYPSHPRLHHKRRCHRLSHLQARPISPRGDNGRRLHARRFSPGSVCCSTRGEADSLAPSRAYPTLEHAATGHDWSTAGRGRGEVCEKGVARTSGQASWRGEDPGV